MGSNRIRTSGIGEARAPGKVILTGEHFVVLGAPAVAMAVNLYSRAWAGPGTLGRIEVSASIPLRLVDKRSSTGTSLDMAKLLEPLRLATRETLAYTGGSSSGVSLEVDCGVPIGAGLGSSASISVAVIAAVARAHGVPLGRREIFKIAFAPESYLHGKPSGVDQATCIFGGVIKYTKPGIIKPVIIRNPPPLLVCDTGIHRSTRGLVGSVVARSMRQKDAFQTNLAEASRISESAVRALKTDDYEDLGTLMNRNQELLCDIGVSHPKLNRLVKAARKTGALGAKLTGAGGGGCLIALCEDKAALMNTARGLRKAGGTPYNIGLDRVGAEAVGVRTVLK